ncbi:MAG: prepilin-type N-terminal cleavage/methylation domain-containing protein [Planctomycetota bacterium]
MNRKHSTGFTLVELLVAMTVTLLLMAALSRSFATIGKSVEEGRARVDQVSKLRDVTFRLRTDLRSITTEAEPPVPLDSNRGYFFYYEGPTTDTTFSNFGAAPKRFLTSGEAIYPFGAGPVGDPDEQDNTVVFNPFFAPFGTPNYREASPVYREFSRFGDTDDVLAFTAEAPPGEFFTGKVPRYLIDDSVGTSALNLTVAMEPVTIQSRYAEIIMWASPVWNVDPTTRTLQLAEHPSAMPLYKDEDRNLVPDSFVLHQRVLLIRPDLNVNYADIGWTSPVSAAVGNTASINIEALRTVPTVGGLGELTYDIDRVPAPLARIYPIGLNNDNFYDPSSLYTSPIVTAYPDYISNGTVSTTMPNNQEFLTSHWLVGMAPLHQFYDISLRRVLHPRTGEPTPFVAANSLEDLNQPHNRFGAVRLPGRFFGRQNFTATSMPLLATGWNQAILNWQGVEDPRGDNLATRPAWFPAGPNSGVVGNQLTSRMFNAANNSQCGLLNGWMLPMFELGDPANPASRLGNHWHRNWIASPNAAGSAEVRWDRSGEDVVASDVLAFDLRGFDVTAPIFTTAGEDGAPGRANIDDDSIGPTPDETFVQNFSGTPIGLTELGVPGSDDVNVGVGDIGIFNILNLRILDPTDSSTWLAPAQVNHIAALSSTGDHVDLAYPYLAGGPLLFRQSQIPAVPPFPRVGGTAYNDAPQVAANFNLFLGSALSGYPFPQEQDVQTPVISNFQNETPTGLNGLKRSGRIMQSSALNTGGNFFFQPAYDTYTTFYESDGFDQSSTPNGQLDLISTTPLVGGHLVGTSWLLDDPNQNAPYYNTAVGGIAPAIAAYQTDTGNTIIEQPETSAPFVYDLPSIAVTIRLSDSDNHTASELTIVESLQ